MIFLERFYDVNRRMLPFERGRLQGSLHLLGSETVGDERIIIRRLRANTTWALFMYHFPNFFSDELMIGW
jgi:hypothetical protein